jgi:FMN phosphatase YigB (HAD superfamily)
MANVGPLDRAVWRVGLPQVRAVVFDFGETLARYAGTQLSWAEHFRPALEQVAEACGLPVTSTQLDLGEHHLNAFNTRVFSRQREVTSNDIFRELLTEWRCSAPLPIATAERAFFAYFQKNLAVYPDVAGTLGKLRSHGMRLAILTDVPYGMKRELIEEDLRHVNLWDAIDLLATSVDVGWRKPSPEGFKFVAKQLKLCVSQLVAVGNEDKDIDAARAAGVPAVLIDRDGVREPTAADCVIRSLADLV